MDIEIANLLVGVSSSSAAQLLGNKFCAVGTRRETVTVRSTKNRDIYAFIIGRVVSTREALHVLFSRGISSSCGGGDISGNANKNKFSHGGRWIRSL